MAKKKPEELTEKILDVAASMQGTITFKDPVNLRINGTFEGKLDTRGNLTIGENAEVRANINGDNIVIAGRVVGDIKATQSISVISPAVIQGNIKSPIISVTEGAKLEGFVTTQEEGASRATDNNILTLKEVAQYLEVETSVIEDWANKKKIPAFAEGNTWKFRKSEVDRWIQEERVSI